MTHFDQRQNFCRQPSVSPLNFRLNSKVVLTTLYVDIKEPVAALAGNRTTGRCNLLEVGRPV